MKNFVMNNWNSVMDYDKNPLSNITSLPVRHMIMQLLAWMWVLVFTIATGTWAFMGINIIAHVVLLTGIVMTVATFETAKRKPSMFTTGLRGVGGEHE